MLSYKIWYGKSQRYWYYCGFIVETTTSITHGWAILSITDGYGHRFPSHKATVCLIDFIAFNSVHLCISTARNPRPLSYLAWTATIAFNWFPGNNSTPLQIQLPHCSHCDLFNSNLPYMRTKTFIGCGQTCHFSLEVRSYFFILACVFLLLTQLSYSFPTWFEIRVMCWKLI